MKRLKFECKLLSDVVLKSNSSTEVMSDNLDYIPGAKFLGIAAKELYEEEDTNKTSDIFHNGSVLFGDAHIAIEGERTLKVPASWFFKKGEGVGDEKYLHHKLTKEIKQHLSAKGIQLKQARKGYFVNGRFVNTENNFSIKSAYDSFKRKAKDSQMYGYFALPKGSTWLFDVNVKDGYVDDIVNALEGKKRIGRSRSAEFGLVKIKYRGEDNVVNGKVIPKGEVIVYAESNLCFYDKYGQNTLQPIAEQLLMPDGSKIIWEKSQIRTRIYQTWNSKRYNRDADRMIIEKGSVFVIKTTADVNVDDFAFGIGAHKNEGFGKVILNPAFLISETEKLDLQLENFNVKAEKAEYAVKEGASDNKLISILQANIDEQKRALSVDKIVNEFIQVYSAKYRGITASQWGQVRNYAKHAANDEVLWKLLFGPEIGYFMHGQSEHKWREGNRRWMLEVFMYGDKNKRPRVHKESRIEFVQKLASEMSKNVSANKKNQ